MSRLTSKGRKASSVSHNQISQLHLIKLFNLTTGYKGWLKFGFPHLLAAFSFLELWQSIYWQKMPFLGGFWVGTMPGWEKEDAGGKSLSGKGDEERKYWTGRGEMGSEDADEREYWTEMGREGSRSADLQVSAATKVLIFEEKASLANQPGQSLSKDVSRDTGVHTFIFCSH